MAVFPTGTAADADLYIGVNNLSTVLTDNPLTVGATTVNVSSTTGFPTVGILTIDLEAIHYTGTTATSFTGCTRAFDGTTAASHPLSTTVFHDIPAAHHNVLKDEIIAIETYLKDVLDETADGTAGAPAYSFGSTTNSGIYTLGSGWLNFATSGAQVGRFNGAALELSDGTVGAPGLSLINDPDSGLYRIGTDNLGIATNGAKRVDIADAGVAIQGTTTNDSAAAGFVGETVESVASVGTSFPTSNAWGDLTSISLTAGDWLVSNTLYAAHNGATVNNWRIGISTTAGNSATGLTLGDTDSFRANPADGDHLSIPMVRMSLSSTTTVYYKYRSNYSVATPQAGGRITAVRIR